MQKILVANRGEIACRVMRTARRIGKKTVAIYSDIDDGALHTRMADEAVCVGHSPALQSYLNVHNVMAAVKSTNSHAVHPGYGFLSENQAFAAACEAASVAFIGPPAHAIESMGDKLRSKQIAADAGVHTIPGFKGVINSVEHAISIAQNIGYPVMMKASGGGGGKGMRIAYNDADVTAGFPLSKQEALNAFNDDRMLVEKYIVDGHHIEIQVVADDHGNVVAFPERECSVQRRNQKVVEESPSCLLTAATRLAMQEQAIALSRAVGYRSAGTIEFICDDQQAFFFLEMNTRLQVEHPITELVSGVDLVEEMINVAENKPLSAAVLSRGPHVASTGHAIESRVYAEDPGRNFLPSIGPLVRYQEPVTNFTDGFYVTADDSSNSQAESMRSGTQPVVRIDSGVDEGSEISMFYDPMISKLVTHGDTRQAALSTMAAALDAYVIQGVGHNVAFLRDVISNSDFAAGQYSTSFIPKHYPEGFKGVQLSETDTTSLAVLTAMLHKSRAHVFSADSGFSRRDAESVRTEAFEPVVVVTGGVKGTPYTVSMPDLQQSDGDKHIQVTSANGTVRVSLDSFDWPVESLLVQGSVNGDPSTLQYFGAYGEGYHIAYRGTYQHVIARSLLEQELSQHMRPPVAVDYGSTLRCPMPGAVVSVSVKEGQYVEEGQSLAVVEAMKMQNVLKAAARGLIKKIHCKAEDVLKVDQVMMEFDFSTTGK